MFGQVYSPPLHCADGIEHPYTTEAYVSKLTSESDAHHEMEMSAYFKELDPDSFYTIPYDFLCPAAHVQMDPDFETSEEYDTLLFSKYGGISLERMIELLHSEDKKPPADSINYFWTRLISLGRFIAHATSIGVFHMDIGIGNIVYDNQYVRLIDLGVSDVFEDIQISGKNEGIVGNEDLIGFIEVLAIMYDNLIQHYRPSIPLPIEDMLDEIGVASDDYDSDDFHIHLTRIGRTRFI
jgi:serine/threonine protein kinase